jgi:hypothetical protein
LVILSTSLDLLIITQKTTQSTTIPPSHDDLVIHQTITMPFIYETAKMVEVAESSPTGDVVLVVGSWPASLPRPLGHTGNDL